MGTLRCKMLLQRTFVSDKSREMQKVWHPFSNLAEYYPDAQNQSMRIGLTSSVPLESYLRRSARLGRFSGGPGSCRKLREAEIT